MDKQAMLNAVKEQLSVKNVKDGFGHDLMGLFADVYLRKKKVGYYNDDGYGGEIDIQLNSVAKDDIEKMCIGLNMSQFLFDNGWDFMKEPSRIKLSTQVEQIIYLLIEEILLAKAAKKFAVKLKKDLVKGICTGNETKYTLHKFKTNKNLADCVYHFGAQAVKQSIITNILPKMNKGDRILNDLKALGIEIPDEVIRMVQK